MRTSSWCWPKAGSWSAAVTTICWPRTVSTAACTTCSSAPDVLSGFTLVRNAVKLDFPIVPAIESVLEVCDEVVVNVGKSEDETRDLVASIKDPRVRILDTEWDFTKKNIMLSIETQRAMDACRGSLGVYIQAAEVLGPPRSRHPGEARDLKDDLSLERRAVGTGAGAWLPGMDAAAAALHRRPPRCGTGMDCRAEPRSRARDRAGAFQARAPALLRLGLGRAADRRPGVRVPQLHDRVGTGPAGAQRSGSEQVPIQTHVLLRHRDVREVPLRMRPARLW